MVKALILAAGEGRRMRPLTLTCPKPLIEVAGTSLIEHHLQRLRNMGVESVVINLAYLGSHIQSTLGSGERFGLSIHYSHEPEPLETGGAIHQALPLLGGAPFILLNGDVWCDYPVARLLDRPVKDQGAHLVLVNNPDHNPNGDFALSKEGHAVLPGAADESAFTYAGIAKVNPSLIADYPDRRAKFPLREALLWAIKRHRLTGEIYSGDWCDVGTPERLNALRARVANKSVFE